MLNFKNDYFEVIEYAGKHEKYNDHMWKCRCKCGKIVVMKTSVLRSGATKSCGCVRNSIFVKGHPYGKRFKPTHGLSKHPLFRVWSHIIDRCYRLVPEHKSYRYYKGKGIKVCDNWRDNFKSFYDWSVANGWQEGLSIDRKDSKGNYEPNNCEFVTRSENSKRMARDNPILGQFNGNSVLKARQVGEIKKRLMAGEPGTRIAKDYKVHKSTIYHIRDNKSWR